METRHSGRTGTGPENPVKAEEDWELHPDDDLPRILQEMAHIGTSAPGAV